MKAPSFEQRQALGCVLASQRGALNLKQEKFSASSGVPLRTIQRTERGAENLEAFATSLGSTGAELLAAAAQKEGSPELRLKLPKVTSAADLVKLVLGR